MSKECTTHHHACDCREAKFKELERENAALNHKLDEILTNKNYEGGVQFWINKHDEVLLREASLLAENAALLKDVCDLVHKNELLREDKERLEWLERYHLSLSRLTSPDMSGLRFVGQCFNPAKERGEGGPSYLKIEGATIRAAIDAARKEAQP